MGKSAKRRHRRRRRLGWLQQQAEKESERYRQQVLSELRAKGYTEMDLRTNRIHNLIRARTLHPSAR